MFTRQIAGTLTRASSRMDEGEVTITTPDRDLMGDTIDHMQMETATYLAGPAAVNYAHDHSTHLPVAKTFSLTKSPTGIRAQFRWRTDPFSREVKAAFDDGVLGASVEFIVPEGRPAPNRDGGFDFGRTILTGWGLTGNPANPRAVKLLKSMRDNLKAIDEGLTLEGFDWNGEKAKQGIQWKEEKKMYSAKTVYDIDENQVRNLVIAGIREAMSSHSKPDPYSEIREWGKREEQAQRNASRQELTWRVLAQVRGDRIIEREANMSLCPCPPPAIAIDLGYAVPSHIRYWPI